MKKLFVITAMMAIINPVCADDDYDMPDGYPLESAKYFRYEDCVAENPDDSVDCVMEESGITWAVAPFPTAEKTASVWWRLPEAWSQIGTDKKLSVNDAGKVIEHNPNKPVPGVVCEYNFQTYDNFYTCEE